MEEICIENGYDERYEVMARAQNSIGWRSLWKGWCAKKSGQFSICTPLSQVCDATQALGEGGHVFWRYAWTMAVS
jgi:hypothetical protein